MLASFSSTDSYDPNGIIIGQQDIASRSITLLSGENAVRGAVLGKITIGAATVANGGAGAAGANTGNGALTMDATTPILAGCQVGDYMVKCITAATNGGTFRVTGPDGRVLGDVAVGATFANQIKFAIADSSTDFVVGDGFKITIAAGSGKYKVAVAAAVDGSAVPDCILAVDCDASSADKATVAYFNGGFNEAKLTFGTGVTAANSKEVLRQKGIMLISAQTTY